MSEKRFTIKSTATELELYDNGVKIGEFPHYEWVARPVDYVVKTLNEQQELIEELKVSDEMGWKRAEHFEKKCPKELHNKKMYIKRLEYKVQKFKEENEQFHQENQELKKKNNALKEDINQSEKRVKHWMMLYEDVYDKMQKRRVSG